jgi:hypothetical protein
MSIGGIRSAFFEYETVYANGGSGTDKTIDWKNGNTQKVAMTDDCTFTFSNPLVGPLNLFVNNNDPLGPYTATWPETVIWLNNTPPTFVTDRTCACAFLYEGTNYYGSWGNYY